MKIECKHIRHFGPSILKAKIPDELVKKINDYVEEIIKSKEKSAQLNFGEGLVGDVTQGFFLDSEFVKSSGWLNFLGNCTKEYVLKSEGRTISKFELLKTWVVRQYQHEFNPTHWHSGHISGAGFLKVPKSFGESVQKKQNKGYHGGKLELIHGSRAFLSNSSLRIVPEVGDFYFFPNYLMHTVYPFKNTNEERRSISFNAKIDEKTWDIFGGKEK